MGYYVKGEYIYVLGKIIEVNAEDSTKYRVKTNLANFYVTESGDTLASNPAEVYTASEMYALMQNIAKMSTEDLHLCFGEEVDDLTDVVTKGWTITELRTMYLNWELDNKVSVGDMVYYTLPDSSGGSEDDNRIVCAIVAVREVEEVDENTSGTAINNIYVLYSDEKDSIYTATRSEISSAHKRSTGVIIALSNLDEAAKKAREDIE